MDTPTRPASWPASRAATAMCSTTWPRRCWTASPSPCVPSCWRRRSWSGCRGRCATPSVAGLTASGCSSRPSGPTCSWCRWTANAAGGATTTCSPTCCGPACARPSRSGWPGCTSPRRPGATATGWSTRPSGTPWPPATRSGRPGWSSGISTRCCAVPRARRSTAGWRGCPQSWSVPGRGCWSRRRCGRCSGAVWRRPNRCWSRPRRRWRPVATRRASPARPTSRRWAGRRAGSPTCRRRSH
jgi:hypothetical protein